MGLLDRLFGRKEAATATATTNTIRYRSGISDTPASLAQRFYGDESKWEVVWRTNLRVLRDEVQGRDDKILPGTDLEIPDAKFDLEGKPVETTQSTQL